MKLKKKIELTWYALFSIVTFHKYYICKYCHKIHKRNGNEIKACSGWYEPHVFVCYNCVCAAANNVTREFWENLSRRHE